MFSVHLPILLSIPLLFLLLISSAIPDPNHHQHSHHQHDHDHGQQHPHGQAHFPPRGPEHRVQREHSSGGGGHSSHSFGPQMHSPPVAGPPPPCGCGGGCPSARSSSFHGAAPNGIPIFLFPDHAQKAVDVILGAEGAFYWDNDELAHRVFDLLAHKFPTKWFIVGVGNSPGPGLGLRILKSASAGDFMHGTVKVSPGHSPFAFFDKRQFPRENETQLWYFVKAVEPPAEVNISDNNRQLENEEKAARKLEKCVRRKTKSCISSSFASECGLDFLALIDQNTQPALYASEPLVADPKQMKVLNSMSQCTGEMQEGTTFYAIFSKEGVRESEVEEEENTEIVD